MFKKVLEAIQALPTDQQKVAATAVKNMFMNVRVAAMHSVNAMSPFEDTQKGGQAGLDRQPYDFGQLREYFSTYEPVQE